MELTEVDLQRLKKVEIKTLEIFIDICKKLQLKYYALGGTCLGAVRHKGFIPWDDDIDIGMPREDYEVFISKAKELLPSKYFLQTAYTDPEWHMHFCKIRNKNTLFLEESVSHLKMNHGVYIDIFPLDYTNSKKRSLRFRMLKGIESRQFIKKTTFKQKIKLLLFKVLTFSFSAKSAFLKIEKKYRCSSKKKYLANYSGAWGDKEIVDSSFFDGFLLLPFENVQISCPSNSDGYLTSLYGDYMKLPPVEKRMSHHFVADFNIPLSESNSR